MIPPTAVTERVLSVFVCLFRACSFVLVWFCQWELCFSATYYSVIQRHIIEAYTSINLAQSPQILVCLVTWPNQQLYAWLQCSAQWITSSRLGVTMAAVCSASTFNYYKFMVKFHEENDLSGAFLRVHCALPRFVEYEHRKTPCRLATCHNMDWLPPPHEKPHHAGPSASN